MSDMNKSHTITIRVNEAVHNSIATIAEREQESQSTILRRMIRRGLELESAESKQKPRR